MSSGYVILSKVVPFPLPSCFFRAASTGRIEKFCVEKQEELQSCSLWNKNHIHRKIDKMKRQRALYQMKEQDKTQIGRASCRERV